MTRIRIPWRMTPFAWWLAGLAALMGAGAVAGGIVFARGLVVTNLTDLVPWGLWITVDLTCIALSAGAFLLTAAVYLLGWKRFEPVARTATFVGLVGYSMAVLMLLLDIGRPDRFWHSLVYWNPHSVLWEVTMCVTLYFGVLALETAPLFGRVQAVRARFPGLAEQLTRVHRYAPYLAVVGLGLSMLHQSSLGATYGVLKARPIWYRPDLSVLFIVSAMAAGPALTALASMIAGRLDRRAVVRDELMERIGHIVGWVLVAYLYLRFWDALAMTYTYEPGRTEALGLLAAGPLSFNFWILEILLGTLSPMVMLLHGRLRKNRNLRLVALGLVILGVAAYRWDTNLVGQLVVASYLPAETVTRYTAYVPALVEVVSAAGVIAYGLMAFSLGVRFLNVVNHEPLAEHTQLQEAALAPA
jgi:Ni/Fe-hydrogenase subunit HybB-like protein